MRQLLRISGITAVLATLIAWGPYSPSGDIQPFVGAGGASPGGQASANIDMHGFTIGDTTGPLTVNDNLVVQGNLTITALQTNVRTVNSNYTVDANAPQDYTVLANANTTAITITLPATTAGRGLTIKKVDVGPNEVTITPAAGTIDGGAHAYLSQAYQVANLVSDGNNWFVAGETRAPAQLNGGFYYDEEFLTSKVFSALVGTANVGSGISTPGGVPGVPTGWTAAVVSQHPGTMFIQTSALNDSAAGYVTSTVAAGNGLLPIFGANGPAFVFTAYFSTPNVLSTSSDRYLFQVGTGLNNSTTTGLNGIYLSYSDTQNSGNWTLAEGVGASEGNNINVCNGSFPPVAATWNKFQLVKAANTTTVSAYVNGTLLCSGASFKGGDPMPGSIGGMFMVRTVFTSGTQTAWMDRTTWSIPAINRTP